MIYHFYFIFRYIQYINQVILVCFDTAIIALAFSTNFFFPLFEYYPFQNIVGIFQASYHEQSGQKAYHSKMAKITVKNVG